MSSQAQFRGFHTSARYGNLPSLMDMVDYAAAQGFNRMILRFDDGMEIAGAPWVPLPGALPEADVQYLIDHAISVGIKVIPELKLLTHQDKFFKDTSPKMLFNLETYNTTPTSPKNNPYPIVKSLILKVLAMTKAKQLHIGHDELCGAVGGTGFCLLPGQTMLPAAEFLKDTLKLHNFLKLQGVRTFMWADMLESWEEFPTMLNRNFHGSNPYTHKVNAGYGKALRDQLPKDIVIIPFHYKETGTEFPNLAQFVLEGFTVLGATWMTSANIINQPAYAATHGVNGMIATTWTQVTARNLEDIIKPILKSTGTQFKINFPN